MIVCLYFIWMFLVKTNKCYELQLNENSIIPIIKSNTGDNEYIISILSNYNWFNGLHSNIDNDNNGYYPLSNELVLKKTNNESPNEMIYLSKMNYNNKNGSVSSLFKKFNLIDSGNVDKEFMFTKNKINMFTVAEKSDFVSDRNTRKIVCTSFNTHNIETIKDNWNCLIEKINNDSYKNTTKITAVFTTEIEHIYINKNHTNILEKYATPNNTNNCKWINSNMLPESHSLHSNNNNNLEIYKCDGIISLVKPFLIEFSPYINTSLSQEALTTNINNSTYFNIIVDTTITSDIWMLGMSFIQEHNITFVTKTGEVLFLIKTNSSYAIINIFLSVFVIILSIILFILFNCCYKKKSK